MIEVPLIEVELFKELALMAFGDALIVFSFLEAVTLLAYSVAFES